MLNVVESFCEAAFDALSIDVAVMNAAVGQAGSQKPKFLEECQFCSHDIDH